MATTTTMGRPTNTNSTTNTLPADRTNNRGLYWGIAIALIIVAAIMFSMRSTSSRDTVAPTAPAAQSTMQTAPVNNTDGTVNNNAATYQNNATQTTDPTTTAAPSDSTQAPAQSQTQTQ